MIGKLIYMDIRKLLCMRTILILYSAFLVFLAMMGTGGPGVQMSSLGFFLFVYFWVYSPVGYGGDHLLGILPVSRRQVVLARYAYSMIAPALGAALIGLIQLARGSTGAGIIAVMLFASGCLFVAIVLPPLLYFGPLKSRYFVMGVYVLGIVATAAINAAAGKLGLELRPAAGMTLLCISLALTVVSYFISVCLFVRRDFGV